VSTRSEFEGAYAEVKRDIERFARLIARDREHARDHLQDALLSALKNWGRIGNGPALKAYLVTCLVRMNRRQNEIERRYSASIDLDEFTFNESLSPEDRVDMQLVLSAIHAMDETYRIPMLLHAVEGYPVREVATMLELGESAVKMRISRGRELLKRSFSVSDVESKEAGHG
jgi:RNA polymerase sigma factor (sigma-70 family)